MKRLAAITFAITLMLTPSASASDSLAHNLQIADAWAAEFPQHPNRCSGGRMQVKFVDEIVHEGRAIKNALGAAFGWTWNGSEWVWDFAACRAEVLSDLDAQTTCWVIAHEVMHFVIGPQHVGPLDPRHPGAPGCGDREMPQHSHPRAPKAKRRVPRSACRVKYGRGRAYRRCLIRRSATHMKVGRRSNLKRT